ncbi:MAG: hypothetical protein WAU47_08540, partial [Desulfobaccales bacterium]
LARSAKEVNFPTNPLSHWGRGGKMNLLNAPGENNRGGEKINGHLFSHETLLQAWPARSPYPGKHDDNIHKPSPDAGFDDAGSPLNLVGQPCLDEIPGEQSRSMNHGQPGTIVINYQ